MAAELSSGAYRSNQHHRYIVCMIAYIAAPACMVHGAWSAWCTRSQGRLAAGDRQPRQPVTCCMSLPTCPGKAGGQASRASDESVSEVPVRTHGTNHALTAKQPWRRTMAPRLGACMWPRQHAACMKHIWTIDGQQQLQQLSTCALVSAHGLGPRGLPVPLAPPPSSPHACMQPSPLLRFQSSHSEPEDERRSSAV